MADCERALGRLDRALDLVSGTEAQQADPDTQLELRIVESGIRRDQGLADAAVAALQVPELTDGRIRPGSARLFYAYADALIDAGREDDAREWFARAAAADKAGQTDAAVRFDELDQVAFADLELADPELAGSGDDDATADDEATDEECVAAGTEAGAAEAGQDGPARDDVAVSEPGQGAAAHADDNDRQ